jgi:formylglycine-generating enzyme required for sulfatase activity
MRFLRLFLVVALVGGFGCSEDSDDDTTYTTLGLTGGKATSKDGNATLTVPSGALSKEETITIGTAVGGPNGSLLSYDIGPTGLVFNKPSTIEIRYDAKSLGTIDASTLRLGIVQGNAWHIVPGSTVDTNSHKVQGKVAHLSTYGAIPASVACGNGAIDDGEQCDGTKIEETCPTQGFDAGELACKSDCTLDISGCSQTYVAVSAGTFTMGSPASEPCRDVNEPEHQVTLTRSFEIGITEVTQGAFNALMGYNPAVFKACGLGCPVEYLSWHEAAAFCNAMSEKEGLAQCYSCAGDRESVTCADATDYTGDKIFTCPGYRLPTQAEWEYAYRAGTTTAFYSGANGPDKCPPCPGGDPNADSIGWYNCNSNNSTHPMMTKQANAWGIYDMGGNVAEWTHDWYEADLGTAAVSDPWGPATGQFKGVRGGYWNSCSCSLRAAARSGGTDPAARGNDFGFRCVR